MILKKQAYMLANRKIPLRFLTIDGYFDSDFYKGFLHKNLESAKSALEIYNVKHQTCQILSVDISYDIKTKISFM